MPLPAKKSRHCVISDCQEEAVIGVGGSWSCGKWEREERRKAGDCNRKPLSKLPMAPSQASQTLRNSAQRVGTESETWGWVQIKNNTTCKVGVKNINLHCTAKSIYSTIQIIQTLATEVWNHSPRHAFTLHLYFRGWRLSGFQWVPAWYPDWMPLVQQFQSWHVLAATVDAIGNDTHSATKWKAT